MNYKNKVVNVFWLIQCLVFVLASIATHSISSMQLSEQQTTLTQRLSYELTIVQDVTEFLKKIHNCAFFGEEQLSSDGEEIEQILGEAIDPGDQGIAELNALSRKLQTYEKFYDSNYQASSALKNMQEALGNYVLSVQKNSDGKNGEYKCYALLTMGLCGAVAQYFSDEEYVLKKQLYEHCSSAKLFPNQVNLIAIHNLYNYMRDQISIVDKEIKKMEWRKHVNEEVLDLLMQEVQNIG